MTERRVHLFIWYIVIVWAGLILLEGKPLPQGFFHPVSKVVAAGILLTFLFERWMWRWRIFHGWLVKRPDLQGTWIVELRTNWKPTGQEAPLPSVTGYLVVRQTYTRLSLRLMTAESESKLRGAEISCDADGMYEIVAVYRNDPSFRLRDQNPSHNGALALSVRGNPPSKLDGHYWTDRSTGGEMVASRRIKKRVNTYEEAADAFHPAAA